MYLAFVPIEFDTPLVLDADVDHVQDPVLASPDLEALPVDPNGS